MDLFDIEVFITVADFKSMNKAAQYLHISQSSVSSRIANLEAEVGTKLFIRSKSGVSLTLTGNKFYLYAGNAFKLIQDGINYSKNPNRNMKQISIGITEPLYQSILPSLSSIIIDHPAQEWKISTGRSKDLVLDVLSQQLDMAIINNSPNLNYQELIQTTLFEERIMLIGPPHYRKDWKSLEYFIQEATFVLTEKGLPLRDMIDNQIFKPLNVYPKKLIEVNTSDLIKEFVGYGIGFSFLPLSSLWQGNSSVVDQDSSQKTRTNNFQFYELHGMQPSQKYICITHVQGLNQPIAGITNTLQEQLQQNIRFNTNQSRTYLKESLS